MVRNLYFILRILSKRIISPDSGDEQRETRLKNWGPEGGFCECQTRVKRICRTQEKFRK